MDVQRRRAYGAFLRSRRARLSPEELGLAADDGRRAPGLRREEVARLAGVSTSWYTFLEQGRDVHPSRQVLHAIARALRLDEDERLYLDGLASDGAPVAVSTDLAPEDVATSLVRLDEPSPYPTYAFDPYCDLVAWNPATTRYYTDFAVLPPEHRNMVRWLVTADEARQRLPEWDTDVRDVVARWRRLAAGAPDRGRLERRVAELRELSTDFARWWDSHDVRSHRTKLRHFSHPDLGRVTLRVIVVESPELAGHRVVRHGPA